MYTILTNRETRTQERRKTMALQWQWKDKIGEAIVADNFTHRTFTKTLYEGNAFFDYAYRME